MKFRLEFDMGNAAFSEEEAGMLRGSIDVLTKVNRKLAEGHTDGVLHDHNGNRIGQWAIEDIPEEEEEEEEEEG